MDFNKKVIRLIKQIPHGKVSSYGVIAALAGSPRAAIIVGQILRHSSEKEQLPWQRVINSKGHISIVNIEYPAEVQAQLLEQEGITVEKRSDGFWIDLPKYLWQPDPKILEELS